MAYKDPADISSRYKVLSLGMIVLVLISMAVMYAEPIKDGDLWFHMAYARFMVQNHTLIPDHTIYSWTPASGKEIYCAWLSELVLYTLYQKGGLTLLFAFRYLCLVAFFLLVILSAKRVNVLWHPLTWLICLTGVLMSPAGLIIKPEMFSYILMTLMVFLWWTIRSYHKQAWLCYLIPVLLLIWINSHGGVIFGMVFVGTLFAGEVMNILLSSEEALPSDVRKHFFIAIFLCIPVTLLTPYGWEYPVQLVQGFVVHRQDKISDFMTQNPYQSIFNPRASGHHFVDYLVLASVVLTGLLWPRIQNRKPDWTLILMNLAFGLLYMRFVRTTYFWAIIVTFTSLYLLAGKEIWVGYQRYISNKYLVIIILAVFLFLSGRSLYESACKPLFGFWVNYVNPVDEAEFIRNNLSGLKMGNDYDSGSYLLWALWPQQKVFIDSRYFPYKEWYSEYTEFMSGKHTDSFLRKYPCDFWFFTYDFPGINYFRKSADWRLAYYGPSGCIFTHKNIELPDSPRKASVFNTELTAYQTLKILKFALSIDDIDTARSLVSNTIKEDYICPPKKASCCAAHVDLGSAFERHGLLDDSIIQFHKALEIDKKKPDVHIKLGNLYTRKHDLEKAIDQYKAALSIKPDSLQALNNLSIIYSQDGQLERSLELLKKMMALQPGNSTIYYNVSCIYARQNRLEESVAWLNKAVIRGFNDWNLLRSDPDLIAIRETPYFKALLESH